MAKENVFSPFLENCKDLVDGEEETPKVEVIKEECPRCKKIRSLFD